MKKYQNPVKIYTFTLEMTVSFTQSLPKRTVLSPQSPSRVLVNMIKKLSLYVG